MIRRIKPDDAKILEGILSTTPNFNKEEINVAMELVNIVAINPIRLTIICSFMKKMA